MIVSRMVSSMYFLMSSLAFFLIALHISACSIRCLLSPFSAISRGFVIRACVGDDILDFTYVMVSLMLSMSSSSCSVLNWFLNSCWNSIFFDPIRVACTLGGVLIIILFLSTSKSSLMLLITSVITFNVDLVDDCYVCDDVWSVC